MASDLLGRRFSEMSTDRDRIEESHTEARGYQTSEGFVQEVVSTSPARINGANGELVQVVTRRKTVTTIGAEGEGTGVDGSGLPTTAPRLSYAGSEVGGDLLTRTSSLRSDATNPKSHHWTSNNAPAAGINNAKWEQANTEYSRTSSYYADNPVIVAGDTDTYPSFYKGSRANVTPTPQEPNRHFDYSPAPKDPIPFNSPSAPPSALRASTPVGGLRVVRRDPPQYIIDRHANEGLSATESPSRRSVRIGDIDTRMIEPSRMSPIQPQPGYAPVRFVTRGQLKQMREQQLWGAPSAPRSSVASFSNNRVGAPYGQNSSRDQNLTAYPSPGSRAFAPAGGQSWHEEGTRWSGDSIHQSQVPLMELNPPESRDEDLESIASSAQGQFLRDQARMRGYNFTPSRRSLSNPRSLSAHGDEGIDGRYARQSRFARSPSIPQYNRLGVMADVDGQSRTVPYSATPYYRTELRDLLSVDLDVTDVAEYLAAMRQTSAPRAPPQSSAAFKLLTRGTYLVKYGRQGTPHERFFALRMIPDDITGRTHPYLVWATHAESAAFKARVHLSYLVQAVAGTQTPNFTRLLTGPKLIEGPHVGDRKSTLPTTYAMTFVFQSTHTRRTVDVLALDEQTFRCWMIVMSYYSSINTGEGAHDVPDEVGTLAPDTPRSQSQASYMQ